MALIAQFSIDTRIAARMTNPLVAQRLAPLIEAGLARTGRHRCIGIADLLTAAVAHSHNVTVLHHDSV